MRVESQPEEPLPVWGWLLAVHPADAATLGRWALRFLSRAAAGATPRTAGPRGGPPVLATTYMVHRFMDADDVSRAWDLMQRGVEADDPGILATQERLRPPGLAPQAPLTLTLSLPALQGVC
ncbi:hypothetical protein BH20ACT8_BH20ACT8_21340 [soil metagenome]|jgi:hypothetical protein